LEGEFEGEAFSRRCPLKVFVGEERKIKGNAILAEL